MSEGRVWLFVVGADNEELMTSIQKGRQTLKEQQIQDRSALLTFTDQRRQDLAFMSECVRILVS